MSMSDMHNLFLFLNERKGKKKISWTTEDFKFYYHFILNTMTFMGIIIFSFGNEQPTELRQGKSHTVCINFLPPLHIETFTFCVLYLAPFLWSGFEAYERCWTGSTGWSPLFSPTRAAGVAALWDHLLPRDLKGQPPTIKKSDATSMAKASRFPSHLCSLCQAHPAQTAAALWCITLWNSLTRGRRLRKREWKTWMMEDHSGAMHGRAQHEL